MWKKLGGYDDVQERGVVAELRVDWGRRRKLTALTARRGGKLRLVLHYQAWTFPFGRVNNYFELDDEGVKSLERALRSVKS